MKVTINNFNNIYLFGFICHFKQSDCKLLCSINSLSSRDSTFFSPFPLVCHVQVYISCTISLVLPVKERFEGFVKFHRVLTQIIG